MSSIAYALELEDVVHYAFHVRLLVFMEIKTEVSALKQGQNDPLKHWSHTTLLHEFHFCCLYSSYIPMFNVNFIAISK
jgi:hypothetical protein